MGISSPLLKQAGFAQRYLINIPYGQFVWREQFTWG